VEDVALAPALEHALLEIWEGLLGIDWLVAAHESVDSRPARRTGPTVGPARAGWLRWGVYCGTQIA
jgi:hypothetical protein